MKKTLAGKAPEPFLVEVTARAVYGSSSKRCNHNYEIELKSREPFSNLLGVYVYDGKIEDVIAIDESPEKKVVKATGCYDVDLWCLNGKETATIKSTIHFDEDIPIKGLAMGDFKNPQAKTTITGHPVCLSHSIKDKDGKCCAVLNMEYTIEAELSGDASFMVYASPIGLEALGNQKAREAFNEEDEEEGDDLDE